MQKLIKIHPLDNVLLTVAEIGSGELLTINASNHVAEYPIGIGHKLAEVFIARGHKIIKYGVPIGSATADITIGSHIHLHNMKSDYIPTYTIGEKYQDCSIMLHANNQLITKK